MLVNIMFFSLNTKCISFFSGMKYCFSGMGFFNLVTVKVWLLTKVNWKTWFDHATKSFHFHPFMLINLGATIFTLYAYFVSSAFKILYAISCCMPTGKLTTFKIHIRFVCENFICL